MIVFDKQEVRDALTLDNIYTLLQDFGADPEYTSFGIIAHTICHNKPGEGSNKLYYYSNSGLFNCFTNCGYFDPFDLVRRVQAIQYNEDWDLNDCVRWVAQRFGISGREEDEERQSLDDWKYLSNYERIKNLELNNNSKELKEYNDNILDRFNYKVLIQPWLNEGISQEAMDIARIGYYPGGEQITIPHYDQNGRFIGLRGRTLSKEDAERYGKYRPLKINNQMYNHPLGFSLYGLNWAKENIKLTHKVIIFESEKSVLHYISMFGIDNDIAVACCGSNLSNTQVDLLLNLGIDEMVIAFDKQYQKIGDDEYKKWTKKLLQITQKYSKFVKISFIFDTQNILQYKSSPVDEGKGKFLYLFKNRLDGYGRSF